MERVNEHVREELKILVDEYRDRCLWFLRKDFYPESIEEILRVLDYISRHGDTRAFRKAGELREWLLQNINGQSACC